MKKIIILFLILLTLMSFSSCVVKPSTTKDVERKSDTATPKATQNTDDVVDMKN